MSSQNIVKKLTHTRGRLFTQYIDYKMICHCICNLFSCWVQLQCFFVFLKQMPVYGISIEMSIPQSVAKIRRTLRPSAVAVATWLYSREHGPRERGLIAKVAGETELIDVDRLVWEPLFTATKNTSFSSKYSIFVFLISNLWILESSQKKQFQHTEKAAFWTLRAKRVAGYFFQPLLPN